MNPNSLLFSQRERERVVEVQSRGGGAMVLGKFSVPGRPTSLEIRGQGTIALAVGAVGCCLNIFFSRLSFFFPFSLFGRRPDIN